MGFITEDFEALEPSWDTSLLFSLEFARRGHRVFFAPERSLRLANEGVTARLFESRYDGTGRPKDAFVETGRRDLRALDLVLLRTDPPVDASYFATTYILERAGTVVLNDPAAIRRYNEKIGIFSFPDRILPTAVVFDEKEGLAFVAEHGEVRRWIAKPTNAFGGMGVAAFDAGDETAALAALAGASGGGKEPVMIQAYNEEIPRGDKRIFLLEGRPIGWVNRVPREGRFLANIHAGAETRPFDLSEADHSICEAVGRAYPAREIPLICIDVIGEKLSEVNVTCPSGMVQINRAMDKRCEVEVVDRLLERAR